MSIKTQLPTPFRALIIGSSGAIGSSFLKILQSNPNCERVIGIHRNSNPAIDYNHVESIQLASEVLSKEPPFHLIINCIGVLHDASIKPEKKLGDLEINSLRTLMDINAFGPALTIKHFIDLISASGGIFATLSAKVGSIEDNRLGGWYGYRTSKAALNMLIKTASIELSRTHPHVSVIAMHPGTVQSQLSEPFGGAKLGRPAQQAAEEMFEVFSHLPHGVSGQFLSYQGVQIPW